MKPVICSGRGWWWWGDQMTNYILLWSLKSALWKAVQGKAELNPDRKPVIIQLKSLANRPNSYLNFHFWLSRKCTSVRVHVLDGEYKCDFFFTFYLIYCLYPSLNFVPLIRLSKGLRVGSYPSWHRASGRIHPGQVFIFRFCSCELSWLLHNCDIFKN